MASAWQRGSEADSMADSQSSFDESTASQNSRPLHPSPDALRLSHTNYPLGESTPSTSFSNPSSQDPLAEDLNHFHENPALRTEGQPDLQAEPLSSVRALSKSPQNRSPTPQDDHKVSNKRMANGEVKNAAQNVPRSPVDQQGHHRNTSIASRGSQIGEANSPLFTDYLC